MVPGTFVLDGEEKLDGERGDENSEPGSGKDNEKAVGMEPGTIMLDDEEKLVQGSTRLPPVMP
jgi:hypothetical protein